MRLNEAVKINKRLIAISFSIGVMVAFLDNYLASIFEILVNQFNNRSLTLQMISFYGLLLLSACWLKYGQEYPDTKLSSSLYLDFKINALKKINQMDYQAYQTLGTGLLIQKVENGAQAGKAIIFDFYLMVLKELLPSMLFSLFFIYQISQTITLILLLGYLIVFVFSRILLSFLYHMKENVLLNEEGLNSLLVRGFSEMVTFRLNRLFPSEQKKLQKHKKEIVTSKVKMTLIHESFFTIFAAFIIVIKITILSYAWVTDSLTIGAVIALLSLVDNAYNPVAIFNVLYVQFKLDQLAYRRYIEMTDLPADSQLLSGKTYNTTNKTIKFSNVSFNYGERRIISNLSLSIKLGDSLALVGESGSGKSTILKLMIGLLKPSDGEIWLGDPLKTLCLDDYYQHIVYISQDSPIFIGTLRENMTFNKQFSEEYILKVLKKVNLQEWYQSLPDGLDTAIGEKGLTLSGGERQRVALARLWFSDCQIIILDEATSAMDMMTEKTITETILNDFADKTIVTIAHRLNSIKDYKRTLVFRDGTLIADGKFDTLMTDCPYLKELADSAALNMT